MKIAILTWINYVNYGSLLQAYALNYMVKKLGFDVTEVDYYPKDTKIYSRKTFLQKLLSIKERMKRKSYSPETEKAFQKFKQENFKLTEPLYNENDFYNLNSDFDCFICGSDQIWSPLNFNSIYFLSFVKDNCRKISYAPSFGVEKIENIEIENEIKSLVNRFDYLSVREDAGARILKRITDKNVSVLVDPTLLLNPEEWSAFAEESKIPKSSEHQKYILCYFLGDDENYWKTVRLIKKITGLNVKLIPTSQFQRMRRESISEAVGPVEFVNLIKNSELVLTDSYHATIFSIIFERKFGVFKRFKDDPTRSQNSRIYHILNLLKLEDRIIEDDVSKVITELPLDTLNLFSDLKNQSIKYLKEALETN